MNSIEEFKRGEDSFICSSILALIGEDASYSDLSDEDINAKLDEEKIVELLHGRYVLGAINAFLLSKGVVKSAEFCYDHLGGEVFGAPEPIKLEGTDDLPAFCESIHIDFLNSQFVYKRGKVIKVVSKKNLVDKGAVYTQSGIARDIVENTLSPVIQGGVDASKIKVLDFATGTGRFYSEIVSYLSEKYGLETEYVVLNSVYAIDLDLIALNITRLKAFSFLRNFSSSNLIRICDRIILRNGLLRESLSLVSSDAITQDDFNGLFYKGFDAIVSNPPYLVLKPSKKIPPKAWAVLQEQINYFRSSGVYSYSIEGMLNLYQISIESMLLMLKPGGELGVICPSTLFADLSASRLRRYLLLQNKVRSIRYYAEKDDLFVNVIQATSIFHLKKGATTDSIDINDGKRAFDVPLNLIQELFPEKLEIPNISKLEWGILQKLKSIPRLRTLQDVRSKRGELDLSLLSGFITREQTKYRLVRGNMISEGGIKSDNGEFVTEEFLSVKSSEYLKYDFGKRRLICQQISNAASVRRLLFCYCESNDILGNSCNYISAEPSTLDKLNIVLNSPLLNWRFRITSSNNHINNYELDELPIIDLDTVDRNKVFSSRAELSDYVCGLYGLNKKETEFIRKYETI